MRFFKEWIFPITVIIIANILLSLCFTAPNYYRCVLHDIQDEATNYNLVYVGQSRGSCAYSPQIIDEIIGTNSYNLCRQYFPMRDVPYLVKEANYKNKLEYVVYDVDYAYWQALEEPHYYSEEYLFPSMNNPKNKIDYFCKFGLNSCYRYLFCRYVAFGTGDIKKIPARLQVKFSDSYRNYEVGDFAVAKGDAEYRGRGFHYKVEHDPKHYEPSTWCEENNMQEAYDAFIEMADYCNTNGIQLICVISSLPDMRLQDTNYEGFSEYTRNLAEQNGALFYDMNMSDGSGLDFTDEDFADEDGHLIGEAAEEFSEYLAKNVLSNVIVK